MKYECIYSQRDKGWVVEAIHDEDEGQISRVLFTGADDERLAREYLRWREASTPPQGEHRERTSAA